MGGWRRRRREVSFTLFESKLKINSKKMAGNQDLEQLKSSLVVRIDQNSESDLQALFDSVLKPDAKRPLQVPLRMRNLPDSFFNPPSTGSKSPSISHSRENSADSAFGTPAPGSGAGSAGSAGPGTPGCVSSGSSGASSCATSNSAVAASSVGSSGAAGGNGVSNSVSNNSGLTVSHPRAHSSPASLQQTYASAQQAQQHTPQPHPRHHHHKQRSYDVISTVDDLGPLPPGWEQARTPEGQVYFLK